jgi:hypothetical protein
MPLRIAQPPLAAGYFQTIVLYEITAGADFALQKQMAG